MDAQSNSSPPKNFGLSSVDVNFFRGPNAFVCKQTGDGSAGDSGSIKMKQPSESHAIMRKGL